MVVWIKEWKDVLTVWGCLFLFKGDMSVLPFSKLESVCEGDVIIISREDDICIDDLNCLTPVYIYEDLLMRIVHSVEEEIRLNYDYYYMKGRMKYARSKNVDTIITGSSYGLFGIDDRLLTKQVNLSLGSQDLYYSIKGIDEICTVNKNIKNIVLCCNYYYFFTDLSRTVNDLYRIERVYERLFGDVHNCILIPPPKARYNVAMFLICRIFLRRIQVLSVINIIGMKKECERKVVCVYGTI